MDFRVLLSLSFMPNAKAEPHAASEIGKTETTRSRALALAPGSTERLERSPQPIDFLPDRPTGGLRVHFWKQKRRSKDFASSLYFEPAVATDKRSNVKDEPRAGVRATDILKNSHCTSGEGM